MIDYLESEIPVSNTFKKSPQSKWLQLALLLFKLKEQEENSLKNVRMSKFWTHDNGVIVTLAQRLIKTTLCVIIIIIIKHFYVLMAVMLMLTGRLAEGIL